MKGHGVTGKQLGLTGKQLGLFAASLCAIAAIGLSGPLMAQTAEEMNKSNNPLNPSPGFNLQDYYAPDIYGTEVYTNDFLMRGGLPLPSVGPVPVPQLDGNGFPRFQVFAGLNMTFGK